MGGFNLQELMTQAKQQAESLQKRMQQVMVDASAGGGSVTVKMNGQKRLLSVTVQPDALQAGDVEMLQDLIVAAVNEAGRKVDEAMQATVGGMLSGLGM